MTTSLTSRERVRRALNREQTDRVPLDFGASRISGIAAIAYKNLLHALGRQEAIRVYDIKQQLAQPSLEMLDRLGGDVVQLQRLGPTTGMAFLEIDQWQPGHLTDGSPCLVPAAYAESRRADGTIEIVRDGQCYAWRSPGLRLPRISMRLSGPIPGPNARSNGSKPKSKGSTTAPTKRSLPGCRCLSAPFSS